MLSRLPLVLTILALSFALPDPALAGWGHGPIARYRANRDLHAMARKHPAELGQTFEKVAGPGLRTAGWKRTLACGQLAVAGAGGYWCYLGSLAANPQVMIEGGTVATVAGFKAVKNLFGAGRIASQAREAGRLAVYLKARSDPTLAREIKPHTTRYYEHVVAKKSNALQASIERLQQQRAALQPAGSGQPAAGGQ